MLELVKENPDVEVHFGPEIAHGDGEISVKKAAVMVSVKWGLWFVLSLWESCIQK